MSIVFQCSAILGISSVRSRYVKPSKPPVCVESTAVGIQTVSIPAAEMMGNATVSEHLPKPEISLIAISLFFFFLNSQPLMELTLLNIVTIIH